MTVTEPPVCARCSDSPDSFTKLEQHLRASKTPASEIKTPTPLMTGSPSMISLSHPLDRDPSGHRNHSSKSRPLPSWMSLLPSQKRPDPSGKPHTSNDTANAQTLATSRSTATPLQLANVSLIDLTSLSSESPPDHPPSPSSTASPPTLLHPSSNGGMFASRFGRDRQRDDIRDPPGAHRGVVEIIRHGRLERRVFDSLLSDDQVKSGGLATTQDPQHNIPSNASQLSRYQIMEREPLQQKPRFSLRKPSTVVTPAESCGLEVSHTPLPSQDIAPARNPLLRELSGLLTSRSGKWILPSRVTAGKSSSKTPPHQISQSSLCVPAEDDTSCDRCGADLTDWWVRRDSEPEAKTDGGATDKRQSCQSCIDDPDVPGAWQ